MRYKESIEKDVWLQNCDHLVRSNNRCKNRHRISAIISSSECVYFRNQTFCLRINSFAVRRLPHTHTHVPLLTIDIIWQIQYANKKLGNNFVLQQKQHDREAWRYFLCAFCISINSTKKLIIVWKSIYICNSNW